MCLICSARPRVSRLGPDDSGQAMVEGAFVLLLLFVFLFGIFEAGRIIQVRQALTDAARAGARRSVAPYTQTDVLAHDWDIRALVKDYLRAGSIYVNDADISIDQSVVIAGDPTRYTRVTVTYPYRIMTIGMFGMLNINLTGQSLMRNETSP